MVGSSTIGQSVATEAMMSCGWDERSEHYSGIVPHSFFRTTRGRLLLLACPSPRLASALASPTSRRSRSALDSIVRTIKLAMAIITSTACLAATGAAQTTGIITGERGTITGRVDVVDGDDLWFGPVRVRLRGIDAPAANQKCTSATGGTWDCGTAATMKLRELIGVNKQLRCKQVDYNGKSNRPIVRCCDGALDIGRELVRLGFAWVYREHETCYSAEEGAAKASKLGVWQADTMPAWEWRVRFNPVKLFKVRRNSAKGTCAQQPSC